MTSSLLTQTETTAAWGLTDLFCNPRYLGEVGGPVVQQFMALIAGNVASGFEGCFSSATVNASYGCLN